MNPIVERARRHFEVEDCMYSHEVKDDLVGACMYSNQIYFYEPTTGSTYVFSKLKYFETLRGRSGLLDTKNSLRLCLVKVSPNVFAVPYVEKVYGHATDPDVALERDIIPP